MQKYRIDAHTHTVASGHAYNTITEMAQEAAKKGMVCIGITEHAPKMPGTCHEFYFQNLRVVEREIDGVELLLGAEVNILDYRGNVDLPQYLMEKLDIIIASLHTPCIKPGSREENTEAVIHAMKNPYVNIIGHPDDSRYPIDYEAMVQAAIDTHTLIEVNNNSIKPGGPRVNTRDNDIEILKMCKKYNAPVCLGSDAHARKSIGDFEYILPLLEETQFPEELIVNGNFEIFKKYINKYHRL